MHKTVGLLFIGILLTVVLRAQDTLPRFTATARGPGKILISWHNKYPKVSQISIQRSTDSLRDFTTLITVPDPRLPENGAVDKQAPHPNFYYRLFIVLDNGKYLFTHAQRPRASTGETAAAVAADNADNTIVQSADTRVMFLTPANSTTKSTLRLPSALHGSTDLVVTSSVYVRKGDTLLGQLTGPAIQRFRDSVLRHSKDTLVYIDGDTLLIKPFVPREVYKVSPYVFAGRYGNIHITLPEAPKRHYAVKFFDETGKLLFELSEIRDPSLILDKTNFHHSGWFRFELYDGDQLKEKNKFFIPREL
jgi:hypothetical protein